MRLPFLEATFRRDMLAALSPLPVPASPGANHDRAGSDPSEATAPPTPRGFHHEEQLALFGRALGELVQPGADYAELLKIDTAAAAAAYLKMSLSK